MNRNILLNLTQLVEKNEETNLFNQKKGKVSNRNGEGRCPHILAVLLQSYGILRWFCLLLFSPNLNRWQL